MEPTPCDIHLYDSDEYNDCIKNIVYEAAQDEWIMLDPRFPNLKGITPKRIDEFLANAEKEGMRNYFEDYLQHVMVYDRDDIVSMCYDLGQQIEKKYPGKLHSNYSIFVTTPRGGHEVLSIFAYTNGLKKEQIPSHIRNISKKEYEAAIEVREYFKETGFDEPKDLENRRNELIKHYKEKNLPSIPDIWLDIESSYLSNKVETVFIIDDIIASGMQIIEAYKKIDNFFKNKVEIIPVILIKRKDVVKGRPLSGYIFDKTLYDTKTVGLHKWDEARDVRKGYDKDFSFNRKLHIDILDYDKLITVRFPWGSPDGYSDKILTTLYESRRGLERIERKQRRCILEPEKCELK